MKKHRGRKPPPIMVPVASMGDIAFLLIIFFMICSQFSKQSVEIDPAVAPDINELQESQVSVSIDANGVVYFQGKPASISDVEWGVRAMVEGKTDERAKMVLFRCDKSLPRNNLSR